MKFWIDGDSCPRRAMDVVLRAGERRKIDIAVVADRRIPGIQDKGAELIVVPHGSGDVDNLISDSAVPGDIVLTRDFALGIRLMEHGVTVLNDRGRIWTLGELKTRLEEAELMRALRDGGIAGNKHRSYNTADAGAFASALDRLLNDVPNS